MADDLPPGFTLDRKDDLPPGFTLDKPPEEHVGGTQTGSVVRGIPIVGPLLDKGIAAVAAAPAAVLPGEGYTAMYNKMLRGQDRYEREHPIASTVGQVAGSTLATVPVARVFPKMFGGATMPGQIGAGGAIGATDAAIRSGGDPNAIMMGGAIGAAGPVMGSVLAPIGQGIVSAGRYVRELPGVRSIMGQRVVPMAGEKVLEAGEAGFKSLGNMARYDPAAINDLTTLIKRDIHSGSVGTPKSAGQTHGILDDIGNMPANPASLHNARKQLQEVMFSHSSSDAEKKSATLARNMIDHFLEMPPSNAVQVAPGINPADVFKTLKNANADWRAGMTSKELRQREATGKVNAASANPLAPFLGEGEAVRTQVANYAKSKAQAPFLTPEARTALETVYKPQSIGEGLLRFGSRLSGTGRAGWGSLFPAGGAAWATGFDPMSTAAVMATGAGMSAGQSMLTRRALEHADKVIRSASPSAQLEMARQIGPGAAQLRPSISDRAYRDEIARVLTLQGQREATENPYAP